MSLIIDINRHLDTEISHRQPPGFKAFISDDVKSCVHTNVMDICYSIVSTNIGWSIRQSMYDGITHDKITVKVHIKESVLKSLTS